VGDAASGKRAEVLRAGQAEAGAARGTFAGQYCDCRCRDE